MSSLEIARTMVLLHDEKFPPDFYTWLNANWPIFEYFEKSAQRTFDAGHNHYSARTIVEVMRHRSNLREIGDGKWKLNNDRTPYMARLYILLHPEQEGFFELRERESA